MNTFSNFSSVNGWTLPGSGTWVERDTQDFYVDENGDIWVPCLCGEGDEDAGADDAAGRVAGPPLARDALSASDAACGSACRCVIQYAPDKNGSFVFVNYPEAILYYPFRALPAGYPMGMLADQDKGLRWFYKGAHTGRVRLRIAQRNATDRMAVWCDKDPSIAVTTREAIYQGVPLRYAMIVENTRDTPAAVTIKRQGAGIGERPGAAQREYFRSQGEAPMEVPPMSRVWLYLGEHKFLRDEAGQALIQPGSRFEAQLELELGAELTLACCAYTERGKINFHESFWPLPPQAGAPEAGRLKGLFATATGVSGAWQLDGRFEWAVDDASRGAPLSLDVCPAYDEGRAYRGWITNLSHAAERGMSRLDRGNYFVVRDDIVPMRVPVAWPAGAPDLDRMLFGPPPGSISTETRAAPANRGVVYHQVFVVHNRGEHERHVQYYVTGQGEGERSACVWHVNEDKVVDFRPSEDNPEALVANVPVPAGKTREIETYFILGGHGGGLGHRLTVNDRTA